MQTPRPFLEDDLDHWIGRVTPWFDPSGPTGMHALDDHRQLGLIMPVGLYVGVDSSGYPLYAGKVRRRDGGIDVRLRSHHVSLADWHSVWLIPVLRNCPDSLLRVYEAALIQRHRPRDNTQHNRSGVA